MPRLETRLGPHSGSWFESIMEAAAELGFVPDLWQRHVLERLFVTKADGTLAARTGLVSVARQNGKTALLELVVFWWLTRCPYGPDPVLLASHDLRLSKMIYETIVGHLEAGGYLARGRRRGLRVTYSFGQQEARLVNGSVLAVQPDTASAGHGHRRVGLLVLDEIWAVRPEAVDDGLLPTQRIHPSPLALMTSTAGDEGSVLFKRWREKGLGLVDTGGPSNFYMAEWSPPPGSDPSDPDTWAWANPTLGDRLPVATMADEADAPDRNAFLRASLNLWVSSAKAWLQPGTWEALKVPTLPTLSGGWIACEVSPDGERFLAVRAAPWTDDVVGVETVIVTDNEPGFWEQVARLMVDRDVRLAVTPPLAVHLPDAYQDRHRMVGYRELGMWTGLVRALIAERRVAHRGDQLLTEHFARAVAVRTEHGQGLSTARSPGPIEAARCGVWATALVTAPPVVRHKPVLAYA